MQTLPDGFFNNSQADIREISFKCFISFARDFDDSITFFTIGDSIIGGTDFIKGLNDVVQEWDKYTYVDYSDRVVSMEWERRVDFPFSVSMGQADIVLNNFDDLFTPDSDSELADDILPYRPIRLYAGFRGEVIPVFIGVTEKMPIIDEDAKTATFHCIDFLYSLLNRPLDESVLYLDERVDVILDGLFQLVGLSSAQLDFDISGTIIPFASWPKGTRLITAVNKLVEADQGRIFMDEKGVIQYRERANYEDDPVITFDAYNNIIDSNTKTQDDIINVVRIVGKPRTVKPKQPFGSLVTAVKIPAGGSENAWISFTDPVTTVDDPVYIDSATTSSFAVNTLADGTGDANPTDVTLSNSSILGQVFKMTFANAGIHDLYVTAIQLFATPATQNEDLYVNERDGASISKYDERILEINNPFFQNNADAQSKALVILNDYSDFGGINRLDVKSHMGLQLDDPIRVNLFDRIQTYKIMKITNKITQPAKYTQLLDIRKFDPVSMFTIGISLIGGTDRLFP